MTTPIRLSAALLAAVWFAGLLTLTQVRRAEATLDCEEYPEYCPPPSCDNFTCLGSNLCYHDNTYNCDLHIENQCTVTRC